jgi:hypothetical protein
MEQNVKVIIKHNGRIPFIDGNGPFYQPICLPKTKYEILKKSGYNVELISEEKQQVIPEVKKLKKEEPKKEIEKKVELVEHVMPIPEEIKIPELVVDNSPILVSDKNEEEIEEVIEEEKIEKKENPNELIYSRKELASYTREKLNWILLRRKVDFKKAKTNNELIDLVLKSNPEE